MDIYMLPLHCYTSSDDVKKRHPTSIGQIFIVAEHYRGWPYTVSHISGLGKTLITPDTPPALLSATLIKPLASIIKEQLEELARIKKRTITNGILYLRADLGHQLLKEAVSLAFYRLDIPFKSYDLEGSITNYARILARR